MNSGIEKEGTCRTEVIATQFLVERVKRVAVKQPRVGLILPHEVMNLTVDFSALLRIELSSAFFEQLVDLFVGVTGIVAALAGHIQVGRRVRVRVRAPATHRGLKLVMLLAVDKHGEFCRFNVAY